MTKFSRFTSLWWFDDANTPMATQWWSNLHKMERISFLKRFYIVSHFQRSQTTKEGKNPQNENVSQKSSPFKILSSVMPPDKQKSDTIFTILCIPIPILIPHWCHHMCLATWGCSLTCRAPAFLPPLSWVWAPVRLWECGLRLPPWWLGASNTRRKWQQR